MSFKELIQSNIYRQGYHVTVVGGGIQPRFAYTIGLFSQMNFELVFPGGVYYSKDEVLQIFSTIIDNFKMNGGNSGQKIVIDSLGEFSFLLADPTWSKLMLLGVFDYYSKTDIPVYQIVPDASHFTYDIPDMSIKWSVLTQPVWQWLDCKWKYKVPGKSQVTTNLEALKGAAITELMRWEEDEWEMFAGSGPDIEEKDIRVVSLGTMLGIDNTLLPAVDIKIGKGLWRIDNGAEWNDWG